jgi:LytS/YehU family sensor histidine kinase
MVKHAGTSTWSWNSFYNAAKTSPLTNTIGAITLGMSIKLTKNWLEGQRRQQALEKEKLETELKFLKYQFNPHFLFNSINSIFFLIHKNPDMASDSLAKFSELLRHQLYESNDNLIPIDKEIDYLENFIELEKLRQNDNLKVSFDGDEACTTNLGIAPFILMTFVENAFKHVSKHKDEPNWIDIKLTIKNKELLLCLINSKSEEANKDVVNYGGIGLKNVQRRLELLYPENFELDIKDNADTFSVKCRIQLSELTAIPSTELMA